MGSAFSFLHPWVLLGGLALPLFWWLIRQFPPPPRAVEFPALRLLDRFSASPVQQRKPPWWLLLLRLLALVALTLGLAGPVRMQPGAAPPQRLLLVIDNSWASASAWPQLQARAISTLRSLDGSATLVAVLATAPPPDDQNAGDGDGPPPAYLSLAAAQLAVRNLLPRAWSADAPAVLRRIGALQGDTAPDRVVVVTDGYGDGALAAIVGAVDALPGLTAPPDVQMVAHNPLAIGQVSALGNGWQVELVRADSRARQTVKLFARDMQGQIAATSSAAFAEGQKSVKTQLTVTGAAVTRIRLLEIEGVSSAAARHLIDERTSRPVVALVGSAETAAQRPLQSGLYYIRRALEPFASVSEYGLADTALTDAQIIMLIDTPLIEGEEARRLLGWARAGGVLVSFAGPRVAENGTLAAPAPLRPGTRHLGGRLSWTEAQPIGQMSADGPFAGLAPSAEVTVAQQVLPLASTSGVEVWTTLADNTPLVSAIASGSGMKVLIHTTAGPDWTTLPLSGSFEAMLRRLLPLARARDARSADSGQPLHLQTMLGAQGELTPATVTRTLNPADFEQLASAPEHPAGLYAAGAAERALNLSGPAGPVDPRFMFPDRLENPSGQPLGNYREALGPPLMLLAIALLCLDALLQLLRQMRISLGAAARPERNAAALAVLLSLLMAGGILLPSDARAQRIEAERVVLGYILTGDPAVDRQSAEGLAGLGTLLATRTAVQPGPPLALDPQRDELGAAAVVYWPLNARSRPVTGTAAVQARRYMAAGGLILFDLVAAGGTADVRTLLGELALPPLEPLGPDHVLARAFYLLGGDAAPLNRGGLWIEDGTSGDSGDTSAVVLGSGSWSAAWANPDAVFGAEEFANRFGINLVMYALTGTYKADQAHVRALLERMPEQPEPPR